MSRRRVWALAGACALLLAGVQYLFAETLAAAAWATPRYSYARNYISDLGVTGCGMLFHGRLICSPRHAWMNGAFSVEGMLFLLGGLCLARVVPRPWRTVAPMLGLVHGAGMLLVGTFNGSQAALGDGTLRYHAAGAAAAIAAGNIAAIAAGWVAWRMGARPWMAAVSAALGGFGLISAGLLLGAADVVPAGMAERGAVYTIMTWEILLGIAVIRAAPGKAGGMDGIRRDSAAR
ncbi:DUF998 domain-containing protein [Robbsia sp. Bb-Pol-6]|uniref:DUF998 domain-containing protein n=1 Tax=Robbsia betulipollinis TaxID=2981849 RepID=A0ABT3ZJ52_9BURK|nr:DUF998 domain-containing protein [Robbsia betulipollinis]MCY0386559.1 DUF998 domain-containing protein [Robbsia betulipollinis]